VGPVAWDLAVLWVQARRYDLGDWPTLSQGYGVDGVDDALLAKLARQYEVLVVAWAMGAGVDDPTLAAEARLRAATLRGDSDARWTQR